MYTLAILGLILSINQFQRFEEEYLNPYHCTIVYCTYKYFVFCILHPRAGLFRVCLIGRDSKKCGSRAFCSEADQVMPCSDVLYSD